MGNKELNELVDELIKAAPLMKKEIGKIIEKGDLTPNELESLGTAARFVEKMAECMGGEDMQYGMRYNYGHNMYATDRSPVTGRYIDRGYSGHSVEDRMIASLEKEMDHAQSEYERQRIQDEIQRIRMGGMR